MSKKSIALEIEHMAKNYLETSPDELMELFLKEWKTVKLSGNVPVRGEKKGFWKGLKDRLVAKIVENKIAGSVTIGFIVSQVIDHIEALGINVAVYRIPISIFVAIVTQAVWEQIENTHENKNS